MAPRRDCAVRRRMAGMDASVGEWRGCALAGIPKGDRDGALAFVIVELHVAEAGVERRRRAGAENRAQAQHP